MNARARELADDACAILAAYGFAATIDIRGRHLKIRWVDANGRQRFLVASKTPSDSRTRLNMRATLRRLLRNGA
jgi:hypothetical protein